MTVLDLSGADTSGFQPIPAGSYNASIHTIEMTETKGGGKLPEGVKMVKVRFAVSDDPYEGHPLFTNYPLPTSEESENSARMLGSFVNFLTAAGEDSDKIKSKGFDIEKLSDLEGRELVVRVAVGEYMGDATNQVKGVKPAGSPTGSSQPQTDLL